MASPLHNSLTNTLFSPYSTAQKRLPFNNISSISFSNIKKTGIRYNKSFVSRVVSESKEPPVDTGLTPKTSISLQIGSPVIIVEAPQMLKTAASVPCLRVNSGLVKAGDVGRIMSRKPKDVWAVRLMVGTYLIDGKYFKPLQLDEDN
ncbi:protein CHLORORESPIRATORY REDUCTION 42, chloroplastic isoform X2 [Rutidosis leptorrhynchoides]|uniref:protein CHLORORESPIRATORY REDUCTION 42, chloroplastic isoform X2 n=1 Tax=Rutidosis leptorrhynchoides TaxID=125765 RepID=UPI003A993CAC